jgi:hypothetical protein
LGGDLELEQTPTVIREVLRVPNHGSPKKKKKRKRKKT